MAVLTIATLENLHQLFSDYLKEDSVPATSDARYGRRTRWFNLGREDLANRFFIRALLTEGSISLTAGSAGPYTLPEGLTRPNALKQFTTDTSGVEYTDPYEPSGATLVLSRNMTTGRYQVTLDPAPTVTETATIWYYANPTLMSASADLVLVDGAAVLFFALQQHFFTQGKLSKMQEASDQYENRIDELLRQDAISVPGSHTNRQGYEAARHQTDHKVFYSGNTRRSG